MTTTTPHTPGPWIADNAQSFYVLKKGEFIANAATAANARLIAAAPDLLAVLEAVAVWTNAEPCFCHVHAAADRARYSPHNFLCECARTAILKAKGCAKP
jgi:hypothetical protein